MIRLKSIQYYWCLSQKNEFVKCSFISCLKCARTHARTNTHIHKYRQTDRQTDGRTDRQVLTQQLPRYSETSVLQLFLDMNLLRSFLKAAAIALD